jgi:hypothetical protein
VLSATIAPLRPFLRRVRRAIDPSARRPAPARPKPADTEKQDSAWLYVHTCAEDQKIAVLEGRHPASRVLVVATGPSARQVLPYGERLHDRYDVVIALNGSVMHLPRMDYFLSVESHAHLWPWYHHPVPEGTIRCVSESGRRLAEEAGQPDLQPAYLLLRHLYADPIDIRHYRNRSGEEGLVVGPRGETRLGRGTVSAQAIHFASMLGAAEIHLIGADLHFHGPVQHYYGDNEYGTHLVDGKRYHRLDVEKRLNPIVEAVHPRTGETVETTLHFRESAAFIDGLVRGHLLPAGITLVDFSDGLISAAGRGDFVTYIETGRLAPPVA